MPQARKGIARPTSMLRIPNIGTALKWFLAAPAAHFRSCDIGQVLNPPVLVC
jgi:hypothetical protein